jgi:sugar phosphate isomerase/epimerase
MVVVAAMTGCGGQITFKKYPNLKVGFTTVNFIKYVPVSKENMVMFIDYAHDKGFAWIEMRDPNAILSHEECKELAAYARNRNIEVGYAIHKGALDADFWKTFNAGVVNAGCFDGPRTLRAVACGGEFGTDEQRKGWTAEELDRLVTNANKAGAIAKSKGLHLFLENGKEALEGDPPNYYGLNNLLDRVSSDVGWQCDSANMFSVSRVVTKPDRTEAFLNKYVSRMGYIHLKTSKNAVAQPVLGDSDLDLDVFLSAMSANDVPYVAIELHGTTSEDNTRWSIEQSLAYLKKRGIVTY